MKTWRRVPADTLCGYCGNVIRAHFPALVIKLSTVAREQIRCPLCAGEPAPDLPEYVAPYNSITPTKKPPRRSMSTFRPPADYSARVLGERE